MNPLFKQFPGLESKSDKYIICRYPEKYLSGDTEYFSDRGWMKSILQANTYPWDRTLEIRNQEGWDRIYITPYEQCLPYIKAVTEAHAFRLLHRQSYQQDLLTS